MRAAIVAFDVRKAWAISSVVRPPTTRSVNAICPSRDSIGCAEMKISRSTSSSMRSGSQPGWTSICVSSSRASAAYWSSRRFWRRHWSMALRLATVVSHAPALRGTPVCGHCVSASTSASCARSSARPTSPTARVSVATILAASIRHTASTVCCRSGTCPLCRAVQASPRSAAVTLANMEDLIACRVQGSLLAEHGGRVGRGDDGTDGLVFGVDGLPLQRQEASGGAHPGAADQPAAGTEGVIDRAVGDAGPSDTARIVTALTPPSTASSSAASSIASRSYTEAGAWQPR